MCFLLFRIVYNNDFNYQTSVDKPNVKETKQKLIKINAKTFLTLKIMLIS